MVRMAAGEKNGLGLYLDVPPADLEASALFDTLDSLLSSRRESSRDAPSFVRGEAVRSWVSAKGGRSDRRMSYFYAVFRDLIGQIPLVGPFIKALLPQSAPISLSADDSTAPMRFLMRRSKTKQVVLVIDNVQFLPFAVREMLTAELLEARSHLRLVLVERVRGGVRLDWAPCDGLAETMDLDLANASLKEVETLIREILPEVGDVDEIASTIYRRSDGNLKSVWFQLRLIASRREDQETLPASYEDVILTLAPLDQAVLRFIVFTVGGLTIANLMSLLHATDLRMQPWAVSSAITDLAALGLLVVNGDRADRVRVEHELVAHVVSDITPEEEKLELHSQAVAALSAVLDEGAAPGDEAVLHDRLLGIVTEGELRDTPSLLSHVVQFIQSQGELERHSYLSSICRDSVCWDVLDSLPDTAIRLLLDAIQKSALFAFGLVATARLRQPGSPHRSVASLYEAKYLVQLYRHDEAAAVLKRLPESEEKRAIAFNIMLNLTQDDRAAEVAMGIYAEISEETGGDQDYVILRNSAHLFRPEDAQVLVEASVDGFEALGRRFGVATALDNLGIVLLSGGSIMAAREHFEESRRQLASLNSMEIYQPLVNLSAVLLLNGDVATSKELLSHARDATPRSLLQDTAMLEMNTISLEVCGGDELRDDVVERLRAAVVAARKSRDLRFVDVVTWFGECLEAALSGREAPASRSARRIEAIRTSRRVALEVFVRTPLPGGAEIDVPFMLSPHWRY